ncbi:MAG: AmmeMemoRadiSam system radical SAM enzyme [Candidatus Pacearchaeota archaeon]|jgi:pyruvate formate lyase activating enzyme
MEKECELYRNFRGTKVRCLACSHKCEIDDGNSGICGVRKNINGKLMLLVYGKIASIHDDPIEKKPIYHFLHGTKTFSIGTVGCNFKCDFCQNYDISQTSKKGRIFGEEHSPEDIVRLALATHCKSISYTYNEPAIFIEYVKDCAIIAQDQGLKNILVTNGFFSDESFEYIKKYIDAMNIDLKGDNEFYKKYCGGIIEPVLELIKKCKENNIHIEVTTLIIPGLNDNEEILEGIAKFISEIDINIPWHISRFFPRYHMTEREITPIETLKKAEEIGKRYGLKYIHLGNV